MLWSTNPMMETVSAQLALAFFFRCPVPLLIRDSLGRVTAFNAAFEQLVGHANACSLLNLDLHALSEHPAQSLLGEQTLICWTEKQGQNIYFKSFDFALGDSDHTRAQLFIDVSKQVQLEDANNKLSEELEQHVLTDSLTGLLNRRGIMLGLEPQVARSRRYNSPISLIALHFDVAGKHDNLIVVISRLLKDQLRWADLIGRTEEHGFILVLPETTAAAALKLADKIKRQIDEAIRKSFSGEDIVISYGITEWRKNDCASSLVKRAENAMNQVRLNESGQSIAL
jgi:diguanylate cyclase (GGDEF)-like protein